MPSCIPHTQSTKPAPVPSNMSTYSHVPSACQVPSARSRSIRSIERQYDSKRVTDGLLGRDFTDLGRAELVHARHRTPTRPGVPRQWWPLLALVSVSVGTGKSGSGAPFAVVWIHRTISPSL